MKKVLTFTAAMLLGMLVVGAPVFAGSIKTWTSSEILRASDLNTVLQHLHEAAEELVGTNKLSDGAVTNAKVNASAGIAHTKLATPGLIPKAYAVVANGCTGPTCTIEEDVGVDTITYNTGVYTVTLTAGVVDDTAYGVIITAIDTANIGTHCNVVTRTSSTVFTFECESDNGGSPSAAEATGFTLLLMDAS